MKHAQSSQNQTSVAEVARPEDAIPQPAADLLLGVAEDDESSVRLASIRDVGSVCIEQLGTPPLRFHLVS